MAPCHDNQKKLSGSFMNPFSKATGQYLVDNRRVELTSHCVISTTSNIT